MITGLSMAALAEQIISENRMKRDFVVPSKTAVFEMMPAGDSGAKKATPVLTFETSDGIIQKAALTDHAFRQITEFAGIPAKYVERMRGQIPDLLQENVQRWLMELAQKRMVRTFHDPNTDAWSVRAFVSDKYKALDNYDLFQFIVPALQQNHLKVLSSQVTDTRLYIQAVNESLAAEIKHARKQGGHTFVEVDDVNPGIVISNSEVGAGSLRIETMFYRRYCTNGAIIGDSIRKSHVGGRITGGGDDEAYELYSDETKKLDDAAFWSKVNDVISGSLNEAQFAKIVERINLTTDIELPDPAHAIEVTSDKYGLSKDEQDDVLRNLIKEGDPTLFGLFNAVTRTAQDAKSYDRAIELERIGGQLMNVDAAEVARWKN